MTFFDNYYTSDIQKIFEDKKRKVTIHIKREDKIHPHVSGNKFRKLKYNLKDLKSKNFTTLLTYGGAFSNHIAASAAATNICGLKSIGVIRGEEIEEKIKNDPNHNPTLSYAQAQGMHLHFVSRDSYAKKESKEEIEKLQNKFGEFYRIPEGGTNKLAVKGCEEILNQNDDKFDIIACCVGTGGTIAGIINSSRSQQKIFGFSALKNHQHNEIKDFTQQNNWQIFEDDIFGGYARTNDVLIEFINSFYQRTTIRLDPIYTGKMMFRLFKMIEGNKISENTKILAIHSGGLQGIKAYNNMLKSKNRLPIIFQ